MDNPFIFGRAVSGDSFINRERIVDRFVSMLSSLEDIALISPHGWGKKSLVYHVGKVISEQNYDFRVCYIDLQGVHSEEAFVRNYVSALSYISASNLIQMRYHQEHIGEILYLPELIALRDRIKLIVFIGNFNIILNFKNPLSFLKLFKSRLVVQERCAYCIYGKQISSKLLDSHFRTLLAHRQVFHLPRIQFNQWVLFIQKRFRDTGKNISENIAAEIASRTNCLPHYVQLVSWHAWNRTRNTCMISYVNQAIDLLAHHVDDHYQSASDSLTEKQISYLKALVYNCEKLCSSEALEKFSLGTSGHVSRLRSSLTNKELIYSDHTGIFLLDPIFGHWLKKNYFRL